MLSWFTDYNDGNVLFLGDWGPPWLILFFGLAVAILVMTWLDLDSLRFRKRAVIVALRAATLCMAIILLLEPALELKHVTKIPNHVAVLVDTSESQSLPTDSGEPRIERAQTLLDEIETWSQRVSDTHIVDFYEFDSSISAINPQALRDPSVADGAQTRILEALDAVRGQYSREDLGGVVLISDGTDNGELAGRVRVGEALDSDSIAQLQSIGAPIHTFATAAVDELRDISIERVIHDDFAFVRNAVTVDVEIRSLGIDSGSLPVTLRRNGQPLQTQQIQLSPDQELYEVTFEFVPELLGKELYSVDVPVMEGEALSENNRDYFILKVIRDKIRVLQVVGRPSWDVRFLRQLLKNNPNVDLISFFILRTNEDVQRAAADEMALIPFPTDELFQEQLGSFDLVVFQNFTYVPYRMRQYLPNIREYVLDGGGFLMVGGEQSFASGGYANTPITDILPIELPSGSADSSLIDRADFRPELTPAGERHPITRLEFDRQRNLNVWKDLPAMPGTNIVTKIKPDATALAVHPQIRTSEGAMPVLSVMDAGKGRSMAMTFDGSWLWNYEHVLRQGSGHAYASFWNSAIRWLIRDPALNLVQIEIPHAIFQPGDNVAVQVRAFRPDYSPAADAEGELRVFRTDLDEIDDEVREETVDVLPFQTNDRGIAQISVPIDTIGAYRVEAVAEVEPSTRPEDDEIFLVLRKTREVREVKPRPELLSLLAESSGGEFNMAKRGWTSPSFNEALTEEINRRRIVDLWSSPWLLIFFMFLLGVEWQLRRTWGRL